MAIYTIVDNRDIDNKDQNLLSSVPSLSTYTRDLSGLISGDYLDDTIQRRMVWMDLSSLTKISSDLCVVFQNLSLSNLTNISSELSLVYENISLSNMTTLSGDIENRLSTIHLNEMVNVNSDVGTKINSMVQQYLDEHGYVPGGGGEGGSASITYKYWSGIPIPLHPGGPAAKDITDATIVLASDSAEYTRTQFSPTVTSVTVGGSTLVSGTDYTIVYPTAVNVGTHYVSIVGSGTYTGIAVKGYTISKRDISDFEEVASTEQDSYAYSGEEIKPQVLGMSPMVKDEDYTVSYKNNLNKGTATITVTGINNCEGSFDLSFEITASSISEYKDFTYATITIDPTEYTYSGSECKPAVTVVDGKGTTLVKDTDYTVSYDSTINVGTGRVLVTAKEGNPTGYFGSRQIEFNINAMTIDYDEVTPVTGTWLDSNLSISVNVTDPSDCLVQYSTDEEAWSTTSPTYGGKASIGENTVYYKLSYENYQTVTGSSTITVGSVDITDATFTIDKSQYSFSGSGDSSTYSFSPTPTVTVGSTTLVNGVDYSTTYENNSGTIDDGQTITAKVTVTGTSPYCTGTKYLNYTIKYDRQKTVAVKYANVPEGSTTRMLFKVGNKDVQYKSGSGYVSADLSVDSQISVSTYSQSQTYKFNRIQYTLSNYNEGTEGSVQTITEPSALFQFASPDPFASPILNNISAVYDYDPVKLTINGSQYLLSSFYGTLDNTTLWNNLGNVAAQVRTISSEDDRISTIEGITMWTADSSTTTASFPNVTRVSTPDPSTETGTCGINYVTKSSLPSVTVGSNKMIRLGGSGNKYINLSSMTDVDFDPTVGSTNAVDAMFVTIGAGTVKLDIRNMKFIPKKMFSNYEAAKFSTLYVELSPDLSSIPDNAFDSRYIASNLYVDPDLTNLSSVVSIGKEAFRGSEYFCDRYMDEYDNTSKGRLIPHFDSLTSIGMDAFAGCSCMYEVYAPKITYGNIGSNAFSGATNKIHLDSVRWQADLGSGSNLNSKGLTARPISCWCQSGTSGGPVQMYVVK